MKIYFLVDHLKFKKIDNASKEGIHYHLKNTVVFLTLE